ncbi:MAG: hypothetical protein LPK13_06060 [Marinobacter sp.]|nr:hypothetical protein [Marinobacter sp.]MDX5386528.1 hypothetical protein [Marinobacter sp.]MDX5440465.1 hypothetical protein [Alteromonadaceae bacterium]MDX5471982.1 hypothetical protein [Marinobacter sp.]
MGDLTRVNEDDWKDDTSLWRYMDVYGFLSLITGKKLKFTSLSEFEDGFEGRMPIQNEVTLSLNFTDMSQSFSRPASEVIDLRNRLEAVRENTWVTSWQQLGSECSLMWRVYGSRQNGVAIKTTAGSLLDALDPSHDYIAGPVRYINYIKEKIPDEVDVSFSFHKQQGYLAEQEFRVAVTDNGQDSKGKPKLIELDLEKVIDKVVISPWAAEWQLNALKRVVESLGIDPQLVRRSSIMKVGE